MAVTMVNIWIVRMAVEYLRVRVWVTVGFLTVPVLVMFIVDMPVIMLEELMPVLVLMPLGQRQPDANSH